MININASIKKIYSLLVLTFLFFLILINTTYSEEKVGSIVTLENQVFAINTEGEKRLLNLYDEIFLQDEILTDELSKATIQYNDNSTIIIKKLSSFKVTHFWNDEIEKRDKLKNYLADKGVGTLIQWGGKAVHEFRDLGFNQSLPFTEKIMRNSLMLPLNMTVTDDEIKYICKCVRNFCND